jgi:hypothetical protein
MSQPVPTPTSSGNPQQDRVARGAHVTLETRKRIPGPIVQTVGKPVSITFEGSQDLEQQVTQAGANEAHLTCRIPHTPGWPDAMLVFLNTPNATAQTSIGGGFVGALGFFDHPEHAAHGMTTFRLPLTAALKAAPAPSGRPNTLTFVPYTYQASQTPPPTAGPASVSASIVATLELVLSQVERQ